MNINFPSLSVVVDKLSKITVAFATFAPNSSVTVPLNVAFGGGENWITLLTISPADDTLIV